MWEKNVPGSTQSVIKIIPGSVFEFRCVVTVSAPAVWLARENIKRLTLRPCINVEYSHGVVYMEYTQHRVDNIENTTYGRRRTVFH